MTLRSSAGTDIYRAGERYLLIRELEEELHPRTFPPCIYSTGYTGRPEYIGRLDIMDFSTSELLPKTHSVLSIDSGGTATFGNDTAIAAIDAAIAWSEAQGRTGPFLLAGTSMGCMDLLAWARTHQNKVKGFLGFCPGINLTWGWQNNVVNTKSAVDAAYGGLYVPATHGPTHDPTMYAAELDFPMLLLAASDDTTTLISHEQAFAAAVGPNCQLVDLGASGGHARSTVSAGCHRPEVAAFIASLT